MTRLPYDPATMDGLARHYEIGPGDVLEIAAPVVATELKRLLRASVDDPDSLWMRLADRADELLDGGDQ